MKRRILWVFVIFCIVCACLYPLIRPSHNTTGTNDLCAESLGLMLEESEAGLTVLAVRHSSPAEHSGIIPGDVLIAINESPMSMLHQLDAILTDLTPPCSIACKVIRQDQTRLMMMNLE